MNRQTSKITNLLLKGNNKVKTLGILFFTSALLSCSDPTRPNVELIQDFMESPAVKAQESDPNRPNVPTSRVPPENTIPVGFKPYPYGTDIARAAKENKNPIEGDFSPEVLLTGQKYYQTNCTVCHGAKGEGGDKQPVSEFMALKPPPMLSPKIRGWSDAEIYHVITKGQGVMGPYASHIPQKYRWQVVNYIRHLQNQTK